MRLLIFSVILVLCLPLGAGTFIPLSSFEDARITDDEVAFKMGTILNLGNCVYEKDLFYNGGENSMSLMPQIQLQRGLNEATQVGMQAYLSPYSQNKYFFVSLNLKRLLAQSEALAISINPSTGYSQNHFDPLHRRREPYLEQSPGAKQNSHAFFAQLPLLVYLKKPGFNCSVKIGYSRFSSTGHYTVTKPHQEPVMQKFDYGTHNIFNAGVSANLPIKAGPFRLRPELGYEVFSLIHHKDKYAGSLTGGLSLSLPWPQLPAKAGERL